MTKGRGTKLITLLVGLLIVIAAVQSVVIVKLYQQSETPEPKLAVEPIQMNLQPNPGSGQSPSGGTPQPLSTLSVPTMPFGRFGYTPGSWDPFQEFRNMRQQMDQMFNDSFGRFRQAPDFQSLWDGTTFSPSMDVKEQNDRYVIQMDIPGAEKSNLSVDVDDRKLTISGSIEETIEEQDQNTLRKERRSGEFTRSIQLPGPVNADEMDAEYKNGVLVITLPRAEKEGSKRHIDVK